MADYPHSSHLGATTSARIGELLDAYVEGGLDDDQLIDGLAEMRDAASGAAEERSALALSELVARVEMIHLNVCGAERRPAIADLLADFEKRHFT